MAYKKSKMKATKKTPTKAEKKQAQKDLTETIFISGGSLGALALGAPGIPVAICSITISNRKKIAQVLSPTED